MLNNHFLSYELQAYEHPQPAFRRNISISLMSISGNLDMYILRCKAQDCQEITQETVDSPSSDFLYQSTPSIYGIRSYFLSPNCSSLGNTMCYYLVGLRANSNKTDSSKYILKANYQGSFLRVH